MIHPDKIAAAGGDWGQYGEVLLQDLVSTYGDKVSIVFADKAVLVGVTRPDGTIGEYSLKHTDVANL